MSIDAFRIAVTAAVLLAWIAFLIEIGVAIALYRIVHGGRKKTLAHADHFHKVTMALRQAAVKLADLLRKAGPILEQAGTGIDSITATLRAAEASIQHAGPRITTATTDVAAVMKSTLRSLAWSAERVDRMSHFYWRLWRRSNF